MKGEIRKLKVAPLTIDDEFTKDGLEAISTLTGKEPYYVVGGIATQSYLPTLCRRPTSDIDLSIVKPLNYTDFKEVSRRVREYLSDMGYNVQTSKHSSAFNIGVENKDGEGLIIEFSRRNPQSFERSKNKLERELANSKRKIVEARNSTYVVSAPEDIIVPKISRSLNALYRTPALKGYLPSEKMSFSSREIRRTLEFINKMRDLAMANPTDLEFFEQLKFISDLFDVRILSEIVGINSDYFNKAIESWPALSEETPEKYSLFSSLLPQLNCVLTN